VPSDQIQSTEDRTSPSQSKLEDVSEDATALTENKNDLESRLTIIENALRLDERLRSIESTLNTRGVANSSVPWWRNAKTITTLGVLIAAIVPIVTVINGIFQNNRDAQRLLIEQQDKIRQTYLDRVLKPGITEGEQQRIFSLLVKLKGDPEFQQWAQEEFNKAVIKVDELRREKSALEEQNQALLSQFKAERLKSSTLPPAQRAESRAHVQRLESAIVQSRRRVTELKQRIGEPVNTSLDEQPRELIGIRSIPSGPPCEETVFGTNVYGDYEGKLISSAGRCNYVWSCHNLFPGYSCNDVLVEAGLIPFPSPTPSVRSVPQQ
jgi:hypothetical protein